jgi:hypothetical protein
VKNLLSTVRKTAIFLEKLGQVQCPRGGLSLKQAPLSLSIFSHEHNKATTTTTTTKEVRYALLALDAYKRAPSL